MPIRKHKKYNRPRKLYDIATMKEEQNLIKKYGLKNRHEVWRADYQIARIRNIAKTLITADEKKKEEFLKRQKEKGFSVESLADILALNKEDWLKRRLQSIVVKKGLTKTYKQARQFIVHKHVKINGKAIDSPSHQTTLEEEKEVSMNLALPEKKLISDEEKQILKQIKPKEDKE
jgi:small subunit ribosomal protein S4